MQVYDQNNYEEALPAIKNGAVTIYPTETVYGMGAVIDHPQSLERIFKIKKRLNSKPLSLNIATPEMAKPYLSDEDYRCYRKIAEAFLPGPLSVIFKTKVQDPSVKYFTKNNTISFRMPNNNLFLKVIKNVGPFAGTSANLSGELSLTNGTDVINAMGQQADVILVDRNSILGVESTILDLSEKPIIQRMGIISAKTLSDFLHEPVAIASEIGHYKLKKNLYLYHNQFELDQLIGRSSDHKFLIWGDNFGRAGNCLSLTKYPLRSFFQLLKQMDEDPMVSEIFAEYLGDDLYRMKLKQVATKWN